MHTLSVEDIHAAPWWPELIRVKDGLSWASLEARYNVRAHLLRAALAAIGEAKAPQAPGRRKRSDAAERQDEARPAEAARASEAVASTAAEGVEGLGAAGAEAPPTSGGGAPPEGAETPPASVVASSSEYAPESADTPSAKAGENPSESSPAGAEAPPAAEQAGAPAHASPPPDPLAAYHALVGTRPDAEVGALAGVSKDAVRAYRRTHEIPAFVQPPPGRAPAASPPSTAPPTREGQVVLRRAPDATGFGLRRTVPPAPAVVADVHAPTLGLAAGGPGLLTPPSPSAAYVPNGHAPSASTGGPEATPRTALTRAAPASPPKASTPAAPDTKPVKKRNRRSALDAYRHLVGKVPDAEVAKRVGLTTGAVLQYRHKHGIPAAGRGAKAEHVELPTGATAHVAGRPVPTPTDTTPAHTTPTAAPALAVVAPALVVAAPAEVEATPVRAARHAAAPGQAFAIRARNTEGDRRFVVVAVDMVDAATRATASLAARSDGPWTLHSVRVLCEAL